MEIRVLKYFLAVAREENITRAAENLHISQPTLSRQIHQLEEEMGTELFERRSHSIRLTPRGLWLRQRAQEIIDLAERTREEMEQQEELSGEIAIGSGEMRSVDYLAGKLADFRKRHPLVRYTLLSADADQIRQGLESGRLDLGLFSTPADVDHFGYLRLHTEETWGVLIRKDSALAEKETVSPEELEGGPVLMPGREFVRREIQSWLGEKRVDEVLTYNLVTNAAAMVRQGLGAAFCLDLMCEYRELRFLPLTPRLCTGSVMVWKRERLQSPAVRALIESLRDEEEQNLF